MPPPFDPLDEADATRSASEPGPDAKPLKLQAKPLNEVARGLVYSGGVAAHQTLARTELERAAGVWLANEDEAAGIGDPLAKIAARYSGGTLVDPTMNDLINAGIALAGYLVRNVQTTFRIRLAMRRAARAGVITEPADDAGDQEQTA